MKQLVLDPHGHGRGKAHKAPGRQGQIGLQQALEFEERFFVKNDMRQFGRGDAGLAQAILNRMAGKARIVLFAAEALFLSGGNDAALVDEAGCAVVIKGGDAQNVHGG